MKRTTTIPTLLKTLKQATEPGIGLQEQIRCRAHELYERRGRGDGHELDDWLRAESEVTQKTAKTVAPPAPSQVPSYVASFVHGKEQTDRT